MIIPWRARQVIHENEYERFAEIYAGQHGFDVVYDDSMGFAFKNRRNGHVYKLGCSHSVSVLFKDLILFDNDHFRTWNSIEELRIWFDMHNVK